MELALFSNWHFFNKKNDDILDLFTGKNSSSSDFKVEDVHNRNSIIQTMKPKFKTDFISNKLFSSSLSSENKTQPPLKI